MINKLKTVIAHPLLAGSLVMVVGSNVFNLTQFFYHFLAGRLLGKANYGDFAAMISILGFFGIIQLSLGLTIIKFVASEKNHSKIVNFSKWINWWSLWVGIVVAGVVIILAPFLNSFLNIGQSSALFINAVLIGAYIILMSQRSILQGLLKFNRYILSLMLEAVFKIGLLVVLVLAGFAVSGAMLGYLVGVVFSLVSTRVSLSEYLAGKRDKKPELAPFFKYSIPVFVQGIALTSMYSIDLLLVKHFFSAHEAGTYASLAILGRIALFGTTPITQTMFPLVANRFAQGKPYHALFYLSTILVLIISVIVVSLYKFFPNLPIGVLFGSEYLDGSGLLWWFGLFMSLLGISLLFVHFYLSIGKTKMVWLFVLAATLQAVLISLFHNSLLTVIQVSIVSAALLALSLMIYFPWHDRGKIV